MANRPQWCSADTDINPFTAPACTISGLKRSRTCPQKRNVPVLPIKNRLSFLTVTFPILTVRFDRNTFSVSHKTRKKKKSFQKTLNFALLLIVFK